MNAFFDQRVPNAKPEDFLIRVNRLPASASRIDRDPSRRSADASLGSYHGGNAAKDGAFSFRIWGKLPDVDDTGFMVA